LLLAFLVIRTLTRGGSSQGEDALTLAQAIRKKIEEQKGVAPPGPGVDDRVQQASDRALEQRRAQSEERIRLQEKEQAVRDKIDRLKHSD
jgi:hypothetical protein